MPRRSLTKFTKSQPMMLQVIGFPGGGLFRDDSNLSLTLGEQDLPKIELKHVELQQVPTFERKVKCLKQKLLYKQAGEDEKLKAQFDLIEKRKKELVKSQKRLQNEIEFAKMVRYRIEQYVKDKMQDSKHKKALLKLFKELGQIISHMDSDYHFSDAIALIDAFNTDRKNLKDWKISMARSERKYGVLGKKFEKYKAWEKEFYATTDSLLKDTRDSVEYEHPLCEDLKPVQFDILNTFRQYLKKHGTGEGKQLFQKLWAVYAKEFGSF